MIWPTPSTCPVTKCPPRRSPTLSGRSRLTRSCGLRSPSVVRARVSEERSAVKMVPSPRTTVRQTPFTAMLCPTVRSINCVSVSKVRRPPASSRVRATTLPCVSTMPVNNSVRHPRGGWGAQVALEDAIIHDALHSQVPDAQGLRELLHPFPLQEHRGPLATNQDRRKHQHQLVHDPCLKRGGGQSSPPLDHDRSDLATS